MVTASSSVTASTRVRATPPSREGTRELKVATVPTEGKTTRKDQKVKHPRVENPRVKNPRVENLRTSPRVDTADTVTSEQDLVILVVTVMIVNKVRVTLPASMISVLETITKQLIESNDK